MNNYSPLPLSLSKGVLVSTGSTGGESIIIFMKHMMIPSHTFMTRSGLPVLVRPLSAEDVQNLVAIFDRMSADSRYQRFNLPVENVSEHRKQQEAELIATMDPHLGFGVIAFADLPGEATVPVGAARLVCLEDGTAEAAMSVIDAMQRQGVGQHLMLVLVDLGRQMGVRRIVAMVRTDNQGILKILHRLPYQVERRQEGVVTEVVIDLEAPQPVEMITPSEEVVLV